MQPGRYFWTQVPYWLAFAFIPGCAVFFRRVASFLRRHWLINEAFFLAVSIGLVSPLFAVLLFQLLPWKLVHYVFFPSLALLVALLYWRVEQGQFHRDRLAMMQTIGAGLLWLAGAIGSGWCFHHHICMDGHMEHPPYPSWHYAADVGWVLAVLLAAVWMRQVRVSLSILFGTLSAFLVSYRFVFGSLGGVNEWLPL